MKIKTLFTFSFIAVLCLAFAPAVHALLIVDEVEDDGSWTLVTAGWSSGANGLEPVAGDNYFYALPGNNQVRGIYKNSWGENYQFGTTLTATFKIGMQIRETRPNLNSMQPYFYVGTDPTDQGTWITDGRVVTGETPAQGEWETWTMSINVFDGLMTQNETLVTESDPIGFFFRMRGNTDGQGAFDDLTIVPEPGAYAALVGLGALTLVYLRRRRR